MTAAMIRVSPLSIVGGPWANPPGTINAGGVRVDAPPIGWTNDDASLMMVNVTTVGDQPTQFHTLAAETLSLATSTLTITRTWNPPTLSAVKLVLVGRLNDRATERWINTRGANAAEIETALSNGSASVSAATTIVGAVAAFQAVSFP